MALEKRLIAVPTQYFTADGTNEGLVSIADTSLFKVKQVVYIIGNHLPDVDQIEVKRVVDANHMYVGPKGGSIDARVDISLYTTILGAGIAANEQPRPSIPNESVERATYEEEPTLARRSILVDKLGNKYDRTNLLPVDPEGPSIASTNNLLAMLVQGSTVINPQDYLINNEGFFVFDNEGNLIKAQ
jgi:hypothetical protein